MSVYLRREREVKTFQIDPLKKTCRISWEQSILCKMSKKCMNHSAWCLLYRFKSFKTGCLNKTVDCSRFRTLRSVITAEALTTPTTLMSCLESVTLTDYFLLQQYVVPHLPVDRTLFTKRLRALIRTESLMKLGFSQRPTPYSIWSLELW